MIRFLLVLLVALALFAIPVTARADGAEEFDPPPTGNSPWEIFEMFFGGIWWGSGPDFGKDGPTWRSVAPRASIPDWEW